MHTLCHIDDIDDRQCKGFKVGEANLFAVRQDSEVFVYQNRCPHLGIALEWLPDKFLDMDGELIQCSTHGALFTIDEGLCVAGPCSGQSLMPVETRIENGEIMVTL